MTPSDNALSLTLVDTTDLSIQTLKALYRITGRSTVELREAVLAGAPVYSAPLFGNDHIHVVPRLEKTAVFLDEHGIRFLVHEWVDGIQEEISREVMREILESTEGDFA